MTVVVPVSTWLDVEPGTELLSLLPAGLDRLESLYAGVWAAGIDPVTLELCRVRIATLVGDVHGAAARDPRAVGSCDAPETLDALVEELPSWPRSPRVSDAQRAALGFAEQFVIDPHGFSDEAAARMHGHFDEPALTTLTMAVAVFDALARVRRFLTGDAVSSDLFPGAARLAVVPA